MGAAIMKILVCGVGSMGWNHARVCSELGVLSGIVEPNEELRNSVSDLFSVPGFDVLEEAVSKTSSTAVIVATPSSTHFEVSTKALQSGQHILVEKPLCDNLEDARKLVFEAENRNLILAVGHIERHNPVVTFVKEESSTNVWGRLLTISSKRASSRPVRIGDVGVILDLAIHDIDNSIYLAESIPTEVYTRGASFGNSEMEDFAQIFIGFEDGRTALVEVNWISPMRIRETTITFEKSLVTLDYMEQKISVSKSKYSDPKAPQFYPVKMESEITDSKLNKVEPLKLEISDFINSIEENKPPWVDGNAGILSLQTTIAALESLRTGKVVRLKDCD